MPKPKPEIEKRTPGRPRLAEADAKGKIVPIRFNPEDTRRLSAAAKVSGQTVSEWIRNAVNAALLQTLESSNQENGSRSVESRRIRRELRATGHRGGLRTGGSDAR